MTLKVRRILSLAFIILFFLITPALILYAAGYKISKNGFSMQRTGMFIIDSKPEGAKIYIDGEIQKYWQGSIFGNKKFIATPAKIKNLLPGEYNVKLELEGYWSWQKKLAINQGDSTFAENIYLFKNILPVLIAQADSGSLRLSPTKNQAVILSSDAITFLNLRDESERQEKKISGGKDIFGPESGDKIIIGDYLYDNSNNSAEAEDLKKLYKNSSAYKLSGNFLYYRDKNSIYRAEPPGSPEKIISGGDFDDYLVKNNILYLITRSGQTTNLEAIGESTGQIIKSISLPYSENYSFINYEQDILNIYDQNKKSLCLIDPLSDYGRLVEIINNAETTFWANQKKLLYANDFEIWIYDTESQSKTLITRISEEIKNASMHKSEDYIIYSTKQSINAIELDEREKRNITELVKFDSIGSFKLSEDDILYFSGKIGNSQGLYKFLMQ
ncbi:MAG: PEGA domain-containing protein [bacterium]